MCVICVCVCVCVLYVCALVCMRKFANAHVYYASARMCD